MKRIGATLRAGRVLRINRGRLHAATVSSESFVLRTGSPLLLITSRRFAAQPRNPKAGGGAGQPTTTPPQSNPPQKRPPQSSNIYEVDETNFMSQVLEASESRVILVDCYAEYAPHALFCLLSF